MQTEFNLIYLQGGGVTAAAFITKTIKIYALK